MSFSISTRHLPSIRTYQAAEAFFLRTKPWRGGDPEIRPLGRRGDSSKTIRKYHEAYCLYLHRTALVTYWPDHVVLKVYDSQSSIIFAGQFAPNGVRAISHFGDMWYAICTEDGTHYYDNEVMLHPVRAGVWRVEGERRTATQKVLDLKRAAEVRKRLKPFLQWQAATMKVAPQALQHRPAPWELHRLCDNPDDLDAYPAVGACDPAMLRVHAYERLGAYQNVTVPLNQLPRRNPI